MSLKVVPVLQLILAIGACWFVSFMLPFWNLNFIGQDELFIVLPAIGFVPLILSIVQFKKANTTVDPRFPEKVNQLVTTGVFKYTRNPMYLSMLLLLIGVAFKFGNPINALIIFAFVLSITTYQIKPEEQILSEIFGDEYLKYKSRTGRWI